MHTVRFLAALGAASSVLVLAGCVPRVATGPMTSQHREIDTVSTVVLDTSGDVSISEGEPSLVIHAPEDSLDSLTSDIHADTLVLGRAPGFDISLGEVRYDLSLPDLERIELNGSGDIDATVSTDGTIRLDLVGSGRVDWTGLDTDRVEIRVSGSGDVALAGSTMELSVELDGSGNIDAGDLHAEDVVVVVGGSGEVDVWASRALSAEVSGSGRVTYTGEPTVNTDVSGSGEVVQR